MNESTDRAAATSAFTHNENAERNFSDTKILNSEQCVRMWCCQFIWFDSHTAKFTFIGDIMNIFCMKCNQEKSRFNEIIIEIDCNEIMQMIQSRAKIKIDALLKSLFFHLEAIQWFGFVWVWLRGKKSHEHLQLQKKSNHVSAVAAAFSISIRSHQFIERQRRRRSKENQPYFWSKIFRRKFSMIYGNKLKSERNIFFKSTRATYLLYVSGQRMERNKMYMIFNKKRS